MSNRMKTALSAAVIAVIVIVIAVLTALEFFVVRYVYIDGAVTCEDYEIIRAAQIDMGGSIFFVDREMLRYHLDQDGRFVLEGVTVEYPDTVVLKIRERTLDVMARSGGQILVMDSDGYVVEVRSTLPENVGIFVTGLDSGSYRIGMRVTAPEDKLEAMKAVAEAVRSQDAYGYVSELNLDDLRNLWIMSRSGIRVDLGDMYNMENKIMWLCSALADLERQGVSEGSLDVSGGNRAVYKP